MFLEGSVWSLNPKTSQNGSLSQAIEAAVSIGKWPLPRGGSILLCVIAEIQLIWGDSLPGMS